MQVSDAIYGSCARYVCRERLEAMLDYEQRLNLERLGAQRGDKTAFFAFADTVSARSFRGNNECHGWMGIRFQTQPGGASQQIVIHVRMLDLENAAQQEALGIVGVNSIYGACFLHGEPERLRRVAARRPHDEPHRDRPRSISPATSSGTSTTACMSLRLVQLGLTGAAMFSAAGKVLQPSEVLYKKPVLVERGRFRPVTYVNLDLAASALRAFEAEGSDVAPGETVSIMEITMRNLLADGEVDLADFLSRADVLATTGHTVMISDFAEYYRLAAYLFRYTSRRIGLAMGAMNLIEILDEAAYHKLDGGILEGFGRLFKNNLKLFVYPYTEPRTNELVTIDKLDVPAQLRQLYGYLIERRCIVQLTDINHAYLNIHSHEVLEQDRPRQHASGRRWCRPKVAAAIKERRLFGYA